MSTQSMTVKQIRVQNKYNRYAPGHGGFWQGKYHWDAAWFGTPYIVKFLTEY